MARLHILKNGISYKEIELADDQEFVGGRGDSCQIYLDDGAISRHHFKVYRDSEGWKVEKLSKFGVLLHEDQPIQNHNLLEDDAFSVPPFYFRFHEEKIQTQHLEETLQSEDTNHPSSQFEAANEDMDDLTSEISDTTSTESSRATPYLTVSKPGKTSESLRLEGVAWTAGRDEHSEIIIDDRRSSRKHFKIYKELSDFYIEDLGSSNGTYVNEEKLSRKPRLLESGDSIVVGDTTYVFEVRDPLMEQELENLPAEQDSNHSPSVVFLPINIGASENSSHGVVRIDRATANVNKNSRAKAMRFGLVLVLVLAAGYSLFDDSGKKESSSKDPKAIGKNPFDRLSQQEQEYIRHTYSLAKNLYMDLKYELALAEMRKIHEKIPSFQDSKEIEALCESALLSIKNKQYEEDVERKQKEAIENAKKIVQNCTKRFSNSLDVEAIEQCLAPATEIDPENLQAKKLIENAHNLIEQKNIQKNNKAEHQRRIKAREAIYQQAKKLQDEGKLIDALETYQRHIASALPDPNKLEDKSKQGVDTIKSEVKQVLASAVQEAEGHISNAEYKEAVVKLEKALELDPNNQKARSLYEVASKELFKKMKALFSDAVVEESLGNVESAKSKWKKILEQDIPKGDYRAKATIKLRKYGE